MPNPRDELPPLPPGWEMELISRSTVVPTIRDLTRFEGHHETFNRRYGRGTDWDPGPSWQELFRHALAWIPNPEPEAIHVWESEGGYVRSC